MKTRFLCSNHLAWLEKTPNLAMVTSLQCADRAEALWEEGEGVQALTFAGSGFEAAQIVLKKYPGPVSERVSVYTGSCALLANILYGVKQPAMARTIVATAIKDLESLLAFGEARREVLKGCQNLLSLGDGIAGPKEITDWRPMNANGAAPSLLH